MAISDDARRANLHIGGHFASTAALQAINPSDRKSGMLATITGGALYVFDEAASSGGLTPTTGTGRWLNVVTVGDTDMALLASTATGEGASLVGIEDPGGNYAATTVEDALSELKAALEDFATTATLAGNGNGQGASTIGIEDDDDNFSATTVEGALSEAMDSISNFSSTATGGGASLIGVEDAGGNLAATDVEAALLELVTAVNSKVSTNTLSSTDTDEGAALVGIEDDGAYFTGTTVEEALQETGAGMTALASDIEGLQALVQGGTTTLVAGVSPSIAATITANSRIVAFVKDTGGVVTLTAGYEAKDADRSIGAPGSFVITAFQADKSTSTADTSTLDWLVFNS